LCDYTKLFQPDRQGNPAIIEQMYELPGLRLTRVGTQTAGGPNSVRDLLRIVAHDPKKYREKDST
jgi:hypothetical protein